MYYAYEKETGFAAGSGIASTDNATHGSTETPPPKAPPGHVARWSGTTWSVVNENPDVCTPRQIRLALIGAGVSMAAIEAAVEAMEEPQRTIAKIEWEYATTVEKSNPLLKMVAAAIDLTQDQVDAIFESARAI